MTGTVLWRDYSSAGIPDRNSCYREKPGRGENGNTGTDAASIRIYLFSYTIKKSAANRSHSLRRIWGMSNSVGRISLTSPETSFIMTTSEKDLLNFLYRLYQADIPERFRSIKFLIYY